MEEADAHVVNEEQKEEEKEEEKEKEEEDDLSSSVDLTDSRTGIVVEHQTIPKFYRSTLTGMCARVLGDNLVRAFLCWKANPCFDFVSASI